MILGDLTVAGLRLCNNLPLHLRDSELPLTEFHRLLKNEDAPVVLRTAMPGDCSFRSAL